MRLKYATFENRVPTSICGSNKRKEVTRGWRNLHNEEIQNL
jgi:hypothetical protein